VSSLSPTDGDELERRLEVLSKLLLTDEPLDHALQRVAQLAVATITGCDRADVTLVTEDRAGRRDGARTDGDGPGLDRLQLALGEGPIFDAMRTCTPVRVDALRAEARWPEFCRRAAESGTASCLVVPLLLHDDPIGALNLYGDEQGAFDENAERVGTMFAAQAAVVLANAQLHQACVDLTGQLEQALESRAVIDQAKGILMERQGVGPGDAFEALRRRSQAENRKVRELAQELVDAVTRG
jgi:GAF domain-containing protein